MRILLFILLVLLTGCAPTQKALHKDSKTERSTAQDSLVQNAVHRTTTYVERRDTLVKVPGSNVKLRLAPGDLKPAYTMEGLAIPRVFLADSMNSSLVATLHTDGGMTIDCNTDSLLLLFQQLMRISEERSDSLTMLRAAAQSQTINEARSSTIVKVYDLWYYLKWAVGIAATVFVLYFIIKIVIKKALW